MWKSKKHCEEKGENAGDQNFLLFLTMFSKPASIMFFKIGDCWVKSQSLENFTKRQNLDSSELKEFADDNFKFDEMGEGSPNG